MRLVLGGVCLVPGGAGNPSCTEADPPGEMATAADGTHHTGMHSCSHPCSHPTEMLLFIVAPDACSRAHMGMPSKTNVFLFFFPCFFSVQQVLFLAKMRECFLKYKL